MSPLFIYGPCAIALFCLAVYALIVQPGLIRRVLALNVMGSGVFLLLAAIAARENGGLVDPVPHAMVLTGIVVAVSATAFALALARRLAEEMGEGEIPEDEAP